MAGLEIPFLNGVKIGFPDAWVKPDDFTRVNQNELPLVVSGDFYLLLFVKIQQGLDHMGSPDRCRLDWVVVSGRGWCNFLSHRFPGYPYVHFSQEGEKSHRYFSFICPDALCPYGSSGCDLPVASLFLRGSLLGLGSQSHVPKPGGAAAQKMSKRSWGKRGSVLITTSFFRLDSSSSTMEASVVFRALATAGFTRKVISGSSMAPAILRASP